MDAEAIIKGCKELLNLDPEKGMETPKALVLRLEELREPLMELRVETYKELVWAKEKTRMPNYKPDPKDKDTPRYTDFDRKIMLDSAIAEIEAEYELVKGLEELVRERVDLLKILLKG